MEKFKIAIALTGRETTDDSLVRQVCDNPTLLELCSTIFIDEATAYRKVDEEEADALVLYSSPEPAKRPDQSVEIIVTEKANLMPLPEEPKAEDIILFRNILERDLDRRRPRIAIVREGAIQNPDLAMQVTTEQGINAYGPYTSEQILSDDLACHFDGIIIPTGSPLPEDLSGGASARFFAGMKAVVTASCNTAQEEESEDGLADASALTKPIYTAIDIIRNRAFYDEARQNPLPKLFRDKREDRRRDDASQPNNNDNTDKAS